MFFITKPSAIRFHGNLAIYCHNCPECKLRLTKRARSGKLLKMISNIFAIKKYMCEGCQKSYYVHAKTYSTETMPGQLKLRLDILENSQSATDSDITNTWLMTTMYPYAPYL
jgi:hypothetical protein